MAMKGMIKGSIGVIATRTGAIRFLDRDGKRILQEEWMQLVGDDHNESMLEWRDVPCVKEE